MHVKGHIAASSIAEVVIAIAVIASCIGVSALIFARTFKVTTDFESVRMQTKLQSNLWHQMVTNEAPEGPDTVTQSSEEDPSNDSLLVITFQGNNERLLWQQHWLKNE